MMAVQRISDMTLDDLRTFVEEVVDHRLRVLLKPADRRTVEEILESIDRNMWTPPPGAPSTLELLREDRDS